MQSSVDNNWITTVFCRKFLTFTVTDIERIITLDASAIIFCFSRAAERILQLGDVSGALSAQWRHRHGNSIVRTDARRSLYHIRCVPDGVAAGRPDQSRLLGRRARLCRPSLLRQVNLWCRRAQPRNECVPTLLCTAHRAPGGQLLMCCR